jgi:hypothetical protein
VAAGGTGHLVIAFIGAGIVFFGFNIWVPMTYTLSTESFPTRARATGFGLSTASATSAAGSACS